MKKILFYSVFILLIVLFTQNDATARSKKRTTVNKVKTYSKKKSHRKGRVAAFRTNTKTPTEPATIEIAPKENTNNFLLANTSWRLSFYQCPDCPNHDNKDWVCSFNPDGGGKLNDIPFSWQLKKDTVSITINDDKVCPFNEIVLVNPSTMYGSQVCLNGVSIAYFTATKILSELTVFDRTHQFRKGFKNNYSPQRAIDAVIVHSSYCKGSDPFNIECVISQFKRHNVSSHYLIDREGYIYRLVDENDVSYHAGFGKMPDGHNWINHRSLGIELINSETEGPTDVQYTALVNLVQDIRNRYKIKYIRGHNHIAPDRKTDPWKFNWKKFYGMMGA